MDHSRGGRERERIGVARSEGVMATTMVVRIGIIGCGRAARVHLARLCALDGVIIAGCADPDEIAARALAESVPADHREGGVVPVFADHSTLLGKARPDALAIFTPPRMHYRPAMDALQAGCHVFIEKPLSTNAQEAADMAQLARARGLKLGVGHQFRLSPSFREAQRRLESGVIGPLRLVTATWSQPWLAAQSGPEDSWRLDPKIAGGGLLADAGDHLLDTLLWTTGRSVLDVAAVQEYSETGIDLVTAAAIRLDGGIPVTLALSAVSGASLFEITYHGELGRLRATEAALTQDGPEGTETVAVTGDPAESIDADFIRSLRSDATPSCPADAAIETVRLLEAVMRSAASGQFVRPA